jgi:hypothetical protein
VSRLTHLDADGAAHMVDVGDKAVTQRRAVATGRIAIAPDALAAIRDGAAKKGAPDRSDIATKHDGTSQDRDPLARSRLPDVLARHQLRVDRQHR